MSTDGWEVYAALLILSVETVSKILLIVFCDICHNLEKHGLPAVRALGRLTRLGESRSASTPVASTPVVPPIALRPAASRTGTIPMPLSASTVGRSPSANLLPWPVPMPGQACRVSFKDIEGLIHETSVTAESVYEAAVLGLIAFQRDQWLQGLEMDTCLRIEVTDAMVCHELTVRKVHEWLEGSAKNPSERVKKNRLRELLPREEGSR